MQDPQKVRQLYRLAERVSANAESIRNATLPHHLKPARSRLLRHLHELNQIKDLWSDTLRPTRRPKPKRPMIGPYDKLSHWNTPYRYGR